MLTNISHGAKILGCVISLTTVAALPAYGIPLEIDYAGNAFLYSYCFTLDETTTPPTQVYSRYELEDLGPAEARFWVDLVQDPDNENHWTGTAEELYCLWGSSSTGVTRIDHYDLAAMISLWPEAENWLDGTDNRSIGGGIVLSGAVAGHQYTFYDPPDDPLPGFPTATLEHSAAGVWFGTNLFHLVSDLYIVSDDYDDIYYDRDGLGIWGSITYGGYRQELPAVIPEPATMLMLGCVGAGMAVARRMRRKM